MAPAAPPEPEPQPPEPPVRGNGWLVFTILLEVLAIAALVGFWVISLRG